jgi:hypothetical protein
MSRPFCGDHDRDRPTRAAIADSTSPQSTTSTTATTMCSESRGWIKGLAVALALATRDRDLGLLWRRVRSGHVGYAERAGHHGSPSAGTPHAHPVQTVNTLASSTCSPHGPLTPHHHRFPSPSSLHPMSDLIPRSNAASSPMYRRLDGFF